MLDSNVLYIDPTAATAVIAMILGGIAGGSMYIKTKWHSLKHKIKSDN
jgi:hypothetical protein